MAVARRRRRRCNNQLVVVRETSRVNMVMSNIILVVVRLSVLVVRVASCSRQDILEVGILQSPTESYVIQKIPLDASRGFLLQGSFFYRKHFWAPGSNLMGWRE
jgi:hypothetical protein